MIDGSSFQIGTSNSPLLQFTLEISRSTQQLISLVNLRSMKLFVFLEHLRFGLQRRTLENLVSIEALRSIYLKVFYLTNLLVFNLTKAILGVIVLIHGYFITVVKRKISNMETLRRNLISMNFSGYIYRFLGNLIHEMESSFEILVFIYLRSVINIFPLFFGLLSEYPLNEIRVPNTQKQFFQNLRKHFGCEVLLHNSIFIASCKNKNIPQFCNNCLMKRYREMLLIDLCFTYSDSCWSNFNLNNNEMSFLFALKHNYKALRQYNTPILIILISNGQYCSEILKLFLFLDTSCKLNN